MPPALGQLIFALLSAPSLIADREERARLSLAQAQRMAPEVLGRRLTGRDRPTIAEASAASGHGLFGGPDGLGSVTLATRAEAIGSPAVCVATRTTFLFAPPRASTAATKVKVRERFALPAFWVPVSRLGQTPQLCSDRSVLGYKEGAGPAGYFSGWKRGQSGDLSAEEVRAALVAFESTRDPLARQRLAPLCEPDPATARDALCFHATATIAALDLRNIAFLEADACPQHEAIVCTRLHFQRPGSSRHEQRRVVFTIRRQQGSGKVVDAKLEGVTLAE